MAYPGSANRYFEADVLSRPRPWLVPLLYDHAVSGLRQLALSVEARDHHAVARGQEKVTRIIGELMASLDLEQGGRIGRDLVALYGFLLVEVTAVVRRRDRLAIERLATMLAGLQVAWTKAAEQVAPRRIQSA